MAWIAALLLPIVAAIVFAWRYGEPRARLAVAIPAAGIAIGLASALAFALLLGGVRSRTAFIAIDTAAWIAVMAALWRARRPPPTERALIGPNGPWIRAAAITLLAAATLVTLRSFVAASSVFPHGEWDAWAQWNLRARFLFRGLADGTWQNAFAPVLAWSHPDYPLLVSASVARLWIFGGADTVVAPIVLGGLLAAATVAAAGVAVARTRGTARGCLAAAVILACPSFVRYSAAQCADVALGFFVLSAFTLWAEAEAAPGRRVWWILSGASAALAGWTKNEGLAVLAMFLVVLASTRVMQRGRDGLRDVAFALAGAAPVVLVIVLFKLTLAPPSYFTAEQSLAQAAASLFDADRVRLVSLSMAREVWLTGAMVFGIVPMLAAFAGARGIDAKASGASRAAIPAMLGVLVIYMVAYLVTPKDLAWQLRTSLDRLVLHVVPTLAWSVVVMCR
jgi:hypothetical protein